jgi:hypothetical protein
MEVAAFRYPENVCGNEIDLSAHVVRCPGRSHADMNNLSYFKGFRLSGCPGLSGCVGLLWQTLNQRVQGSSPCAPTIDS